MEMELWHLCPHKQALPHRYRETVTTVEDVPDGNGQNVRVGLVWHDCPGGKKVVCQVGKQKDGSDAPKGVTILMTFDLIDEED